MHTYAPKHHGSRASSAENATSGGSLIRSCRQSVQLQRAPGNQALQRLLQSEPAGFEARSGASAITSPSSDVDRMMAAHANPSNSIQAKLKTSTPGDAFEREAERVADQVVHLPEHQLQRHCGSKSNCPSEREQPTLGKEQLQTKSAGQNELRGDAPPIVNEVLRSSGRPLDANTRDFMESRFGYDFSGVRLHTDAKAAKSAQAVNANAYTVGRHIALAEGQYAPQTLAGRQLLAHELTHVVHQTGAESGLTLQRQPAAKTQPAKTYPWHLIDCNQPPHTEKYVNASLERALEETKGDCLPKSMRDEILPNYNGLEVLCTQDEGPCAYVPDHDEKKMRIFKTAYQNYCPGELAAAIFHETVHFTQSTFEFLHGEISWDCQEKCFPHSDPNKRGKASGCGYERGALPFLGASYGLARVGKQGTSYFRLYAGIDKRRWIASYLDFSAGVAATFIGETESGEPKDIAGSSQLFSVFSALRLDPGEIGGGYFSVSGGLGVARRGSDFGFGKEIAIGAGVRWRSLDLAVNIGADFDPTRAAGLGTSYHAALSVTVAPKIKH